MMDLQLSVRSSFIPDVWHKLTNLLSNDIIIYVFPCTRGLIPYLYCFAVAAGASIMLRRFFTQTVANML